MANYLCKSFFLNLTFSHNKSVTVGQKDKRRRTNDNSHHKLDRYLSMVG